MLSFVHDYIIFLHRARIKYVLKKRLKNDLGFGLEHT